MTAYIQIQWTTDSLEEAKKISHRLLEKKWVACANIIPNVLSIYSWHGKIQEEEEIKVFFKTVEDLYEDIREYITAHASYDVPEVAKILIDDSNPSYTEWVISSTV